MLLVFLHYLGGSASEWDGVIDALPSAYDVMPVDLPGYGEASGVAGYGVSAMAEHVAAALRARPPAQFAIVGHSMGAKVATVLARRAEDGEVGLSGLSHLVLIAGSPPGPEPMADDKRATMLSWFQGDAAASRRQAASFVDDNVHVRLLDPMRDMAIGDVLRSKREAWMAWLTEGSREDWTARVGKLATPTLVIAGEKDTALGPDAQREATLPHFADATIEVIEGGAHLLPIEHPAKISALIVAHIDPSAVAIPAPYRALIQSPRVSAGTRRTLLARMSPPPPATLSAPARGVLDAMTRRVIPQAAASAIDLAARVAAQWDEALGDGWRHADLPPDVDAAERGTRTLDAATARAFATLDAAQQDDLLRRAAEGTLAVPGEGLLSAPQMRLWFEDIRSAITRAYVSHPATLARMGYSGIANGGDGPRKVARTAIDADERETWEPVAERH